MKSLFTISITKKKHGHVFHGKRGTYPYAKAKPKIMERRGSILGSNSVIIRFLETNRTVIILSTNNKFNSDSFGDTKSLKEALVIESSR